MAGQGRDQYVLPGLHLLDLLRTQSLGGEHLLYQQVQQRFEDWRIRVVPAATPEQIRAESGVDPESSVLQIDFEEPVGLRFLSQRVSRSTH